MRLLLPVERLGAADAVTLLNVVFGFVTVVAALAVGPGLAARLVLLAAIADGLDGVVARVYGGSEVGPLLDSVADIVSFTVAPALVVYAAVSAGWGVSLSSPSARLAVALLVPALFVVSSVVRTVLYTVYGDEFERRPGVQNTLASTILVAGYLAGVTLPVVLLVATVALAVLMVANVPYPKLYARDALAMGVVQALAILVPGAFGRLFPRLLLLAALAYLVLAPRFYWRAETVV